jgi:methionine-S-sulfoxide reductase
MKLQTPCTAGFSLVAVALFVALVGMLVVTSSQFISQSKSTNTDQLVTAEAGQVSNTSEVSATEQPIDATAEIAVSSETSTAVNVALVDAINSQDNPVARDKVTDSGQREVITLAGGCFWCSEAFLQETPGVVDVVSGYAGGNKSEANYRTVSTGKTGHREAVQVTFDPGRISIDEVLDVYWGHIDPTDTGGQFADRGFQYTTAIYYDSPEQKVIAESSKARLAQSGLFGAPIATIITPYTTFFKAEEYHQDYYKKSSEHYERYKKASGRAGFVEENWAKAAALEFFESENQ